MASFDDILELKRRHAPSLLKKRGVCGLDVQTGKDGQPVLTVHLDANDPQAREQLPDTLDGHPVNYEFTGPFRAQ
jgi:hypothetical protein